MNITNIPAPRVPFLNARTGDISREWYLFLLNLFTLTGSGQSDTTITDLLVAPSLSASQESQLAEIQKQLEGISSNCLNQLAQVEELSKRLQALEVTPEPQPDVRNTFDKIIVKAGTVTEPSITTVGDENTGVYFPAADKVAVTTGGVERFRFGDAGDIAMTTGKKFYLDGVTESGDTYLVESAANVVDLYVGGVKALTVTTTGTTLAGHPGLEGVTATGATGTGKLVFATSPSLVTPDLGTPSVLIGTNITGTAAGLTAGSATYATTAGGLSPGSGVTGTKAPPVSVTVTNGLITAWL